MAVHVGSHFGSRLMCPEPAVRPIEQDIGTYASSLSTRLTVMTSPSMKYITR
jgi:hypothetical protein